MKTVTVSPEVCCEYPKDIEILSVKYCHFFISFLKPTFIFYNSVRAFFMFSRNESSISIKLEHQFNTEYRALNVLNGMTFILAVFLRRSFFLILAKKSGEETETY